MAPELLFPALGLPLVALPWPMAARRVRPNLCDGLRVLALETVGAGLSASGPSPA